MHSRSRLFSLLICNGGPSSALLVLEHSWRAAFGSSFRACRRSRDVTCAFVFLTPWHMKASQDLRFGRIEVTTLRCPVAGLAIGFFSEKFTVAQSPLEPQLSLVLLSDRSKLGFCPNQIFWQ